MLKKLLQLSLIILATFSFALTTQAADLTGYAWSSNIGWISMKGPNYGVTLNGNQFGGYAWSHNIGWINFNNTNLTGFAKALAASVTSGWDGQIKLGNGTYGVTNNGNYLSGYAWGDEVVGWVKFCNSGGPDAGYCVKTSGLAAYCSVAQTGNIATWSATLSGGTADTYSWTVTNPDGTLATNPPNASTWDVDLGPSPAPGTYSGQVTITTTDGRSATCNPPAILNIGGTSFIPPEFLPPVDGKDRMEISSQPLTSPAISSTATFSINHHDADTVRLKIRQMSSANGTGSNLLSNFGVQCRWSKSLPASGAFTACSTAEVSLSQFEENAYLNIRVDRPTETIKSGSPYAVEVEMPDYPGVPTTSAIFDYRVGTVNPI